MGIVRGKMVAAALLSVVAFVVADAYVGCLTTFPDPVISHLGDALAALPGFVVSGGTSSCASPAALASGTVAACGIWVVWAYSLMREGNFRNGEEHGSARWGTRAEGRRFLDDGDPDNNLIFTKHYGMAVSRSKFDLELDRNRNVLVIGGPGSGKTRYYVKPNLMQLNASYFVTDPKGTLLRETGGMFEQAGYSIKVFDTVDFSRSMHYNPVAYVRTQADVYQFVDCLIKNTTPKEAVSTDPFWEKSERMLYMALLGYLVFHCPAPDRSLTGLMTLLALAEAREDDEDYMSPLDLLFHEIETGMSYRQVSAGTGGFDEESRSFANGGASGYAWVRTGEPVGREGDFALDNYRSFKSGAAKTMKSIIISCNARLSPLTFQEVRCVIDRDEMGLDRLGDAGQRTVVFAIMRDTADSFAFLLAIMMWQALNLLCDAAISRYGGSLPTPVHFVFDEFANIGTLPEVEKAVAVVRSRNMSISVILQSIAQLKSRYHEDAQTIVDCCDTTLFLGGKSNETNKEISEMIGKETVATLNVNESRGVQASTTRNYGKGERDLVQASEVARLRRSEAIVLIAGANPLIDRKYDLEAHPRYAYVDPGHPGAAFDEPFDIREHLAKTEVGP